MAPEGSGMCVNARAHLEGEAGSGAEGRMAASEPSQTERRGLVLRDARQRQSHPRRFGGVQC
jgi:hypothetical protein